MPYIKQDAREKLQKSLADLTNAIVETSDDITALPGLLNYTITALIKRCYYSYKTKLSYSDNNAIIGFLDCAKMEFYRRTTAPYEDEKIIENGDV